MMKIYGDNVVDHSNINKSKSQMDNDEKMKKVFQKVFLEKMISEMFKSTKVVSGTNEFEKDIYTEKMSEMLANKFIESTDIRWDKLFGYTNKKEE